MASRQNIALKEIDDRILQDLVDLLFFQYPKARESIISYECKANKMPAFAFTELRDFIDHINLALHQDLKENIPHHLAQAEEHLRRAVAEPYQGVVQDEIKAIEALFKRYDKCWFKQLPFVPAKTLKLAEYYAKKRGIHDLLQKGRTLKACNIWSDDFEKAMQDCFLPAHDKCILLKQELIESLVISKERTERMVLAFLAALFFTASVCFLKAMGNIIFS
jgi:hypothetical protein